MRDKFRGASSGTPHSTLQPQSRTCTKALLASLGNQSWARRNAPPCGHFPQQQPEIYCLEELGSVQSLSRIRLFATPWTAARQASLSITNSRSLRKLKSTELVTPSSHRILCRPLLLLLSIFPSIRIFS